MNIQIFFRKVCISNGKPNISTPNADSCKPKDFENISGTD